jgi:hypothetical protein
MGALRLKVLEQVRVSGADGYRFRPAMSVEVIKNSEAAVTIDAYLISRRSDTKVRSLPTPKF